MRHTAGTKYLLNWRCTRKTSISSYEGTSVHHILETCTCSIFMCVQMLWFFPSYISQLHVPTTCPYYMSQLHMPTTCPYYMSPLHVPATRHLSVYYTSFFLAAACHWTWSLVFDHLKIGVRFQSCISFLVSSLFLLTSNILGKLTKRFIKKIAKLKVTSGKNKGYLDL